MRLHGVTGRWRSGAAAKGPTRTPDFRRIDPERGDSYVWDPSVAESPTIVEETVIMAHRIRRAWSFALAISPIAAIALVEAALRRWA